MNLNFLSSINDCSVNIAEIIIERAIQSNEHFRCRCSKTTIIEDVEIPIVESCFGRICNLNSNFVDSSMIKCLLRKGCRNIFEVFSIYVNIQQKKFLLGGSTMLGGSAVQSPPHLKIINKKTYFLLRIYELFEFVSEIDKFVR